MAIGEEGEIEDQIAVCRAWCRHFKRWYSLNHPLALLTITQSEAERLTNILAAMTRHGAKAPALGGHNGGW